MSRSLRGAPGGVREASFGGVEPVEGVQDAGDAGESEVSDVEAVDCQAAHYPDHYWEGHGVPLGQTGLWKIPVIT